MGTSIEVFFSYAREDKELCEELEKHLHPLKRLGTITTWHDRAISAGSEWKSEIDKHLNAARIILLLVSPDFLASDYCYNVEMKRAMERHKRRKACVIPVLLRPTAWEDTLPQYLKVVPTDGRPVTEWKQQDKAFVHIVEEIKKVVWELQKQPGHPESKQQEKSKSAPSPQNKKTDHPAAVPPAQNKKPGAPITSHKKSAGSGQATNNQTSNIFQGQVQGVISGGTNTIHINTTLLPIEDALAKARSEAGRGYSALRRKDYIAAKRCLETADQALSEDELPTESAQIKYHMAIALLNGQRPFSDAITRPIMEYIEQMLSSAIKLQPLHSYYYTLALLKRDFARHGLPRYKDDAQNLFHKARRINLTKIDTENLRVLTLCQPRLVNDAQHW